MMPKLDADAQAFITASGISGINSTAINTLVIDLKSASLWTKMKCIYPFVGSTSASQKYNLKDARDLDIAYRLTFIGGGTFSNNGYQGNAVNSYANTNLNVNTVLDGTNSHLSYYSRTIAPAIAADYYMIGALEGTNYYAIDIIPNMYSSLGSFSIANNAPITNSSGFFIVKKETNNNQKAIRNLSILDTKVQMVTTKPNFNLSINALIFTGGIYGYSPFECAFSSIGDGLTDAEAVSLYNIVQNFQTTLSRQV